MRLLSFFVLALVLPLAGCRDEIPVHLVSTGLPADQVVLEVRDLGRVAFGSLAARAGEGDVDAARLLPTAACEAACHALEVTLFVKNPGALAEPPPVVRLSSPEGRPPRQPVPFTAEEISPGRMGRIRLLVSLWPEEKELLVRLSGSVFFEVSSQPRPSAPSPVDEETISHHRP
jgi:hypothetical protein